MWVPTFDNNWLGEGDAFYKEGTLVKKFLRRKHFQPLACLPSPPPAKHLMAPIKGGHWQFKACLH